MSAAPAAPASLLFPPSNPHSSMAPIPASQVRLALQSSLPAFESSHLYHLGVSDFNGVQAPYSSLSFDLGQP